MQSQAQNKTSFADKLATFVATAGGVGYTPRMPGTAGSLVALPLAAACHYFDVSAKICCGALVLLSIAALWAIARCERTWARHDDSRIVIDEVAGQWLCLALSPHHTVLYLVLGFLAFRLFDIWKPAPIGWIDEYIPGAWGTFFDDIVAGLFAAGLVWILFSFLLVKWLPI